VPAASAATPDLDRAAGRRVRHRVEREVEQRLRERAARRGHRGHGGGEREPHPGARRARGHQRLEVFEERRQRGRRRHTDRASLRLAAGHGEQAAHEPVEPVDLADDERAEAGAALGGQRPRRRRAAGRASGCR
jgi:hypothetical protein